MYFYSVFILSNGFAVCRNFIYKHVLWLVGKDILEIVKRAAMVKRRLRVRFFSFLYSTAFFRLYLLNGNNAPMAVLTAPRGELPLGRIQPGAMLG
ncbi:hypothetical protein AHMF7605_27315 [Adhaeribacter arboris]|uniref:Uncharacterized protein n=2 Tax=Adhaeribacter arboris TaxID=2072846 RepID=A0A2T2YN80_9BACT|nr:hypothetical protein AHMF7605_27315 [Adhaeribacter arboris]